MIESYIVLAERIGRLVKELDSVFAQVKRDLSVFADFLEKVSGK